MSTIVSVLDINSGLVRVGLLKWDIFNHSLAFCFVFIDTFLFIAVIRLCYSNSRRPLFFCAGCLYFIFYSKQFRLPSTDILISTLFHLMWLSKIPTEAILFRFLRSASRISTNNERPKRVRHSTQLSFPLSLVWIFPCHLVRNRCVQSLAAWYVTSAACIWRSTDEHVD